MCRPTCTRLATCFAASAVAREAFGQEVIDHYLNRARVELEALESTVTDWERFRGFETPLMAAAPVIGITAAVERAALGRVG